MLSPNATNFVAESCGGRVTVTAKPHDALRWEASRAVHVTGDAPTENMEPLAGWQSTTYGPEPPLTVGAAYVTATGPPVIDWTLCGAGQLTVSAVEG
jgi:hypothetical protein